MKSSRHARVGCLAQTIPFALIKQAQSVSSEHSADNGFGHMAVPRQPPGVAAWGSQYPCSGFGLFWDHNNIVINFFYQDAISITNHLLHNFCNKNLPLSSPSCMHMNMNQYIYEFYNISISNI